MIEKKNEKKHLQVYSSISSCSINFASGYLGLTHTHTFTRGFHWLEWKALMDREVTRCFYTSMNKPPIVSYDSSHCTPPTNELVEVAI